MTPDPVMVSVPEACRRILGVGRTKFYDIARSDPTFPKAAQLGGRCARFFVDELRAWLASRPRVEICTGVPAARSKSPELLTFNNSKPPAGTAAKPPPVRRSRKRVRR
jgi:predicted DNA-binding transcriptional regulator AlpA